MKKVGIITIYDEDNYGNRLQNYAVQEILKSLGIDAETIKNINIIDGINYLDEAKKISSDRREKFLQFNSNIKTSEKVIFHDNIPENFHEEYDYFVIGSDQIWNYEFPDRFSDFVFADFAPTEKRIALSASFGINEIPSSKIHLYEKLKDIKYVSVREDAGKDILLNQLGMKNAEVLIDPTLMLSADKWEKVMKKPDNLKEKKYILKYFLGPVSASRQQQIEKLAKENDYERIDLINKNGDFYATGPSEFIYLIKNSEIVLTDSFHSCVFSIIFNKPFLYFQREGNLKNINSRLETLFNKFEITNRTYDGKIEDIHLNFDASEIHKKIKDEQKKVLEYLNNCFN